MDYATEVENGLACKDRCEERVNLLNSIIDRNARILTVSNTQLLRNTIFTIVVGTMFCLLGFYMGMGDRTMGVLFGVLGVVFVLRGIFGYTRSTRFPEPAK